MSTTTDIFTARQMEIIEGCLNDTFKKLTGMMADANRSFAAVLATKIIELNEVIAIVEKVTQAVEPPVMPEPEKQPETDAKEEPKKGAEARICKFCVHCTGRIGHARASRYICGLSDAEFGPNLGCEAFIRKEEQP